MAILRSLKTELTCPQTCRSFTGSLLNTVITYKMANIGAKLSASRQTVFEETHSYSLCSVVHRDGTNVPDDLYDAPDICKIKFAVHIIY